MWAAADGGMHPHATAGQVNTVIIDTWRMSKQAVQRFYVLVVLY